MGRLFIAFISYVHAFTIDSIICLDGKFLMSLTLNCFFFRETYILFEYNVVIDNGAFGRLQLDSHKCASVYFVKFPPRMISTVGDFLVNKISKID